MLLVKKITHSQFDVDIIADDIYFIRQTGQFVLDFNKAHQAGELFEPLTHSSCNRDDGEYAGRYGYWLHLKSSNLAIALTISRHPDPFTLKNHGHVARITGDARSVRAEGRND